MFVCYNFKIVNKYSIIFSYIIASHNVGISFVLTVCIMLTANGSPNITVASVFNVTVGQEHTLSVSTFDPDGDVVTVDLTSTLPDGATWQNNDFVWSPANMNPINITYVLHSVLYF